MIKWVMKWRYKCYDGLVQDYGISNVLALEKPQSCTKPWTVSNELIYTLDE